MAEPTVHTFDLSAKVCYCGHVHAAPTHTISDAVTALDLMIGRERAKLTPLQRFIADSVTETTANLMLYGTPKAPTLSPEWADRLWKLAQQPEQPRLDHALKVRVRVDRRLPPDRIVPRYDFSDVLFAPWRTDG